MVDIPPGFDELFKVNISKMKINFPSEIKQEVMLKLAPILKLADETYRSHGSASLDEASVYSFDPQHIVEAIGSSLKDLDSKWGLNLVLQRRFFPSYTRVQRLVREGCF
jgi:hypothetical protein